jgi:hypothetical protein
MLLQSTGTSDLAGRLAPVKAFCRHLRDDGNSVAFPYDVSWYDSSVPEMIAVYKLTTWHKYRLEVRSVLVLPVEKGVTRPVRDTFQLDQTEMQMAVRFRVAKRASSTG